MLTKLQDIFANVVNFNSGIESLVDDFTLQIHSTLTVIATIPAAPALVKSLAFQRT